LTLSELVAEIDSEWKFCCVCVSHACFDAQCMRKCRGPQRNRAGEMEILLKKLPCFMFVCDFCIFAFCPLVYPMNQLPTVCFEPHENAPALQRLSLVAHFIYVDQVWNFSLKPLTTSMWFLTIAHWNVSSPTYPRHHPSPGIRLGECRLRVHNPRRLPSPCSRGATQGLPGCR